MSAAEEKTRVSGDAARSDPAAPVLPTINPSVKPAPATISLHPSVYIASWITLSGSVILFNKWILHSAGFPLFLTTWHLVFATILTQLMARYTKVLDSRHKVPMTRDVYLRAIVPIGAFFSLSLICSNMAYLYLSVSFIQMLKATNAVATLLATWALGVAPPNMKTLANVSVIVVGVVIASFGEIKFDLTGFTYQVAGIIFESIRLVMVQRLLSSSEFKMDPLVSLYYFAPACAAMNAVATILFEGQTLTMGDINKLGMLTLLANAGVAFMLNVSVVFLIGKTSALVLTLCGVLKDILLVVASMVIFLDPVTPLQFFGYSIALGGLMYYKLGADKIKDHVTQGRQMWAEYGNKNPGIQRAIVIGLVLLACLFFLSYLFPYGGELLQEVKIAKMPIY